MLINIHYIWRILLYNQEIETLVCQDLHSRSIFRIFAIKPLISHAVPILSAETENVLIDLMCKSAFNEALQSL